jgi:hypothetical protein
MNCWISGLLNFLVYRSVHENICTITRFIVCSFHKQLEDCFSTMYMIIAIALSFISSSSDCVEPIVLSDKRKRNWNKNPC